MSNTPNTGAGTLHKYFGRLPSQSVTKFRDEIMELSSKAREQLVNGIKDGTLTY